MKFFLFTLILICFLNQTACRKGGRCEEPFYITNSAIQVIFKEKNSGKYLYEKINPIYNIDSLKIYDQSGNELHLIKDDKLIPNTSQHYWEVNFGPLYNPQTDQNSFQIELCKEFYIQYIGNQPLDTVSVCFTTKELKCGSVFPILKVYYKGELIGAETNNTGIVVTILKE